VILQVLCNIGVVGSTNSLSSHLIAHGNAISQTALQVANSIGTAMLMAANSHPAGGVVAMTRGVNAVSRFVAVLIFICLVIVSM
jgi:hypothetical protein